MRIVINDQDREVTDGLSVASLLVELSLEPLRVAVELNRKIVRRKTYADTTLADGDQLEIVTLVGGG